MPSSARNEILLDTYAWIEYFRGSKKGERLKKIVESDAEILTPTIVVAELSDKYRRTGRSEEWTSRRQLIELRSEILPLTPDSADHAGRIKVGMREKYRDFPLADGMILALCRERNAKLLTGDKHLRGLRETLNLKAGSRD